MYFNESLGHMTDFVFLDLIYMSFTYLHKSLMVDVKSSLFVLRISTRQFKVLHHHKNIMQRPVLKEAINITICQLYHENHPWNINQIY